MRGVQLKEYNYFAESILWDFSTPHGTCNPVLRTLFFPSPQ